MPADFPPWFSPEVHETTVDGVRCFWVEAARPFTAMLLFRVGVYDEPLHMRGITHLVEHLALHRLHGSEVTFNAQVTTTLTQVWAQGPPDACGTFLRRFCDELHSLPIERLDKEASVLQRESSSKPYSFVSEIMNAYFGPFGPGMGNHDEIGLGWLGPKELTGWAGRYFTRQNAVLFATGRPPQSWGIVLPDGGPSHYRLPERHRPAPESPTLLMGDLRGVTWGALVRYPRGELQASIGLALQILARRLENRLRHELGKVYSVFTDWSRLDASHVFVTLWFESDPKDSRAVALDFQEVVTEFIDEGPSTDEIAWAQREAIRAHEDAPDAVARNHGYEVAESAVMGWTPATKPATYLASQAIVTPEEVKDRFAELYRQSYTIADLPPGVLATAETTYSKDHFDGVMFTAKRQARQVAPSPVVVGPGGVSLAWAEGWEVVPTDELVLVDTRSHPWLRIDHLKGSRWIDTSLYHNTWPEAMLRRLGGYALVGLGFGAVLALFLASPAVGIVAGVGVWALKDRLGRWLVVPLRTADRSLTIPEAAAKYLPEDKFLPEPRRVAPADDPGEPASETSASSGRDAKT